MKLRKDEVDAIVSRLLEKQQTESERQENDYRKKLESDGRFEEFAHRIKKEFGKDMHFFFNFYDGVIEKSVKELAESMRKDYFNEHFEAKGLKSSKQLSNEVIILSQQCKTYEEIINKINPFYNALTH